MLYPLGWNRMTELLLQSLDEASEKAQAQRRLYELGRVIVGEWARHNDVRKINSANVATWGSALRTAAEENEQLEFISQVERDVAGLIEGRLKSSEIKRQRYYPPAEHDNF
ncbi:MAG: hypothetical protein HKN50_05920 [Gammaproteobacteria bacterium]|nr:hypothetical protein [Gammaproteobacteria bacterium]